MRDPRHRLQAIGDARIALEEIAARPQAEPQEAAPRRGVSPLALAFAVAAGVAATVGILALGGWLHGGRSTAAAPGAQAAPHRAEILGLSIVDSSNAAISPDGSEVIGYDMTPSKPALLRRAVDSFEVRAIPGSESAFNPFYSPDGRSIGFFVGAQVCVLELTGSSRRCLAQALGFAAGNWGRDGEIVFSSQPPAGGLAAGLWRVPSAGGEAQRLTSVDAAKGERAHLYPQILPDGRSVLFTVVSAARKEVAVVPLAGGASRTVLANAARGRFAHSGHLVYWDETGGRLAAVRFDPDRLAAVGTPTELGFELNTTGDTIASFDVSDNGTLIYSLGGMFGGDFTVDLVDRRGQRSPVIEEHASWGQPRLSPDGRQLLLRRAAQPDCSLWLFDFDRRSLSRLGLDGDLHNPLWLADRERFLISRDASDGSHRQVFEERIDGGGALESVVKADFGALAESVSADGRYIALTHDDRRDRNDILVHDRKTRRDPAVPRHPVRRGPSRLLAGRHSPRLRRERFRAQRGLRASVPRPRRQVHDLQPRRDGAGLVARRAGAVLRRGRQADAGGNRTRAALHGDALRRSSSRLPTSSGSGCATTTCCPTAAASSSCAAAREPPRRAPCASSSTGSPSSSAWHRKCPGDRHPMIGSRLGPYEITGKLGEGGMGEVYRATDTKLEREVAIKVLPAAFTEDKERLARFEREARLLAQLNHPNIAQIYGLETSGETHALVMELVPGPTLAERLESGPLPSESLSFALQIAQALEEAHEKGIVHRDLKPQNVKASTEGKAKVLDFGLAKAMDATGPGASAADLARSPTIMNSPTLTAVHGTQLGVILGTAAYMAPEQARGAAVDKRADIWAFGVVLYEMLTGRSLFAGPTVSDTLAGVLKTTIDLAELPADTPAAIRSLLRRCLERNPKNRLHDIADARLVIEDVIAGRSEELPALESQRATAAPPRSLAARAFPWVAGLAVGAGLLAVVDRTLLAPAPVEPPTLVSLTYSGKDVTPAASPDGKMIAFASTRDGSARIWLKQLATGEEVALTSGPADSIPKFSPDGSSLLFLRGTAAPFELYRVSTVGGEPRRIAAGVASGPAWSPDGRRIAIGRSTTSSGLADTLVTLSAEGDEEREVARVSDILLLALNWSPDGATIGSWAQLRTNFAAQQSIVEFDVASGERKTIYQPSGGTLLTGWAWCGPGAIVVAEAASQSGRGGNLLRRVERGGGPRAPCCRCRIRWPGSTSQDPVASWSARRRRLRTSRNGRSPGAPDPSRRSCRRVG